MSLSIQEYSGAYLFGASIHDLVGDLFDMLLHDLTLVFVLEAESFVFDYLFLLFFEGLVRRSLLLLLGWHVSAISFYQINKSLTLLQSTMKDLFPIYNLINILTKII